MSLGSHHLSPAVVPKTGSHYDLGMALCFLGAEEKLSALKHMKVASIGELSLGGRIRKVSGVVALIECLHSLTDTNVIFVPRENEEEARLVGSSKTPQDNPAAFR